MAAEATVTEFCRIVNLANSRLQLELPANRGLFSLQQERDLCHGLSRSLTKPFYKGKLDSMIKRRLILEQDIAILINKDSENNLNSTSDRKYAWRNRKHLFAALHEI